METPIITMDSRLFGVRVSSIMLGILAVAAYICGCWIFGRFVYHLGMRMNPEMTPAVAMDGAVMLALFIPPIVLLMLGCVIAVIDDARRHR